MRSGLQFIIYKLKSYWRLFFQRMPMLRNATGVALLVFSAFYFIRFGEPLEFQFTEPSGKVQFIQVTQLSDLYNTSATLELFDTAPIFIPTQWNYGSSVFPEKRVLSDAEFVSFEPLIEIGESIELSRIEFNPETLGNGILYENTFFDPRLLALFTPGWEKARKEFSSDQILRVEIIKSYDEVSSEKEIFELSYDLQEEVQEEVVLSNLNPMVVFFRNKNSLVSQPRIYQSSLSEIFDEQILEWLNQPRHIALLPEGFLKLTFYPN